MHSDLHMKARNQRKLLLNTRRQESTDCLVWNGQISNGGYGRLMMKTDDGNKMVSASRAAHRLFIGPVQKDKIVLPRCRNHLCVNPEHLDLADEVPLDYWPTRHRYLGLLLLFIPYR